MSLPPNFYFPVHDLSSDKVKLTPFDTTKHSAPFIASAAPHPHLYRYMSLDPFPTVEALNARFFDEYMTPAKDRTCFAVLDKSSPVVLDGRSHEEGDGDANGGNKEEYPLAGMISLMSASPANLSAEIGWVLTLPAYQRTHVTTHAIGLLLRYALETSERGGLGLRRVQWIAHSENEASVNAARRMGFRVEGVLRWHRVIGDAERRGKVGGRKVHGQGEGAGYGRVEDRGRDSVFLSLCWDDWVAGERERVRELMGR